MRHRRFNNTPTGFQSFINWSERSSKTLLNVFCPSEVVFGLIMKRNLIIVKIMCRSSSIGVTKIEAILLFINQQANMC